MKNKLPHIKKATNENLNRFIGIKLDKNNILLSFPESYNYLEDNIYEDLYTVLEPIVSYNKNIIKQSSVFESSTKEEELALLSYFWVIEDFLMNGYYVNVEKQFTKNNKGKINWKKTIEQIPIITNDSLYFKDIIVETKSHKDNIMIEIHKWCLKTSLKYVGWVKNISHETINVPYFTDDLKGYYLYQIKKEYSKTFNDKERERLRHFRNIIVGLNEDANNNDFSFGTDSYEYVYEYMINRFFGGINISKEYQPKSHWKFVDGTDCQGSSLMPDTIVEYDSNKLFIIDAKYYRFGSLDKKDRNRNMPPTSSVHKQIAYGDHNSKIDKRKEVYNIFVMPYNKENKLFTQNDENILYIGYAQMDKEHEANDKKSHERVHTFLIDLKYLINNYKKNNRKIFETIINDITKLP